MIDRYTPGRRRRIVAAAIAAGVTLAVSVTVVVARSHTATTDRGTGRPVAGQATPARTAPTTTVSPAAPSGGSGVSLTPAPSAAQVAAVRQLMAPVLGIAPAASTVYPAIPVADRAQPDLYAAAFVEELLGRNYASSRRAALLGWAESEEAPDPFPSVPAGLDNHYLLATLIQPVTAPTPGPAAVPTPAAWSALGQEGAYQTVSDVTASPDPAWEQAIAGGATVPSDPLYTDIDVTATVTLHDSGPGGVSPQVSSVQIEVAVGTAAYHRGYGAAAITGYTVTVGQGG